MEQEGDFVSATIYLLPVTFPHVGEPMMRYCIYFTTFLTNEKKILVSNRPLDILNDPFRSELFFDAEITAQDQVIVREHSPRVFVNKYSAGEFFLALREQSVLQECNNPGHNHVIKIKTALVVAEGLSDGSKRPHYYFTVTEHHQTEYAIGFETNHDLWLRPLNPEDIRSVIRQMASSLDYLHRDKLVVHMDVAYGNIANSGNDLFCKLLNFSTAECVIEGSTGILTFEKYFEIVEYLRDFYHPNPRLHDLRGDTFPPEFENAAYATLEESPYQLTKKDIWCLGVFMFTLLTGGYNWLRRNLQNQPVLWYEQSEIFQVLDGGDFAGYIQKNFPNLDPLAIDLLQKMLQPKASRRISIEQVMAHPYITDNL